MDTAEGFNLGSPYYSYRLANPDEWKWQVGDILYWNKGNHSFKFGVDELHNYDFNNTYGGDGNGYYVYSYVGNYINDQIKRPRGKTGNCSSSAARNTIGTYACYSHLYANVRPPCLWHRTMDSGVFGQDNWKLSPRLTLELGLRWDYEALPPADPESDHRYRAASFPIRSLHQQSQRQKELWSPHRVLIRPIRQRRYGPPRRLRRLLWPHQQWRIAQHPVQHGQPQGPVQHALEGQCLRRPDSPEHRQRHRRLPTPPSHFQLPGRQSAQSSRFRSTICSSSRLSARAPSSL